MSDISDAYDELVLDLSQDEDDDVTVTDDGLLARGTLFLYLEGDSIVIKLPADRSDDLVARGVAKAHADGAGWVSIADVELWPELAGESHSFVGEPAVGGES
ncbi:hypothetical protein EDF46_2323 [Frondihabitans sp. PhB188]|uniref:hypothetical protein n=1 Tax=Frondihabitans sp. PhB188 TaxID=2485200 RepID=UPI000F4888CF|nr:hypothetical protein [Frondihabitans sp. PhB188]ROQ38682.1 hypothetical protein EDF46_2323 [Frondihabitans sp. PhB188]